MLLSVGYGTHLQVDIVENEPIFYNSFMDNLMNFVGKYVNLYRNQKDITLQELAKRTKISLGILSQLERGERIPSLDNIWRLATELSIPFGALMQGDAVLGAPEGIEVSLIDRVESEWGLEIYEMRLPAWTKRWAEPHSKGVWEEILVRFGEVKIGNESFIKQLVPGDVIRFAADKPHFYETGSQATSLWILVLYSNGVGSHAI